MGSSSIHIAVLLRRLCANVPGQYAVIPALQDKSIKDLVAPGGRLYEARKVILNSVAKSKYMSIHEPQGLQMRH